MILAISLDLCFRASHVWFAGEVFHWFGRSASLHFGALIQDGALMLFVACPLAVKRDGCVLDLSLQLVVSLALIHFGWGGPILLGQRFTFSAFWEFVAS